jgi:hypothetical protein
VQHPALPHQPIEKRVGVPQIATLTPPFAESLQSCFLTWNEFVGARSWDKRMNAWYVAFNKRALLAAKTIYSAASRSDA